MIKKFALYLSVFTLIASCGKKEFKTTIDDADLSELQSLLGRQPELLIGREVKKEVMLGEESETSQVTIDSLFLQNELSVFSEYDWQKVFLSGGYEKTVESDQVVFYRKAKEKQGPTSLVIKKPDRQITSIEVSIDMTNLLYQSGALTSYDFTHGVLSSYTISGQQDVMGLSESTYSVRGEVIN